MEPIWIRLPNEIWLDIIKLSTTVNIFIKISIIKPELFKLVLHHHTDNQLKYFSGVLVNTSLQRYYQHVKKLEDKDGSRQWESAKFVVIHEFTFSDYYKVHGSELIGSGGIKQVDLFVDDLPKKIDFTVANPPEISDLVEILIFQSTNPLTTLKTKTDNSMDLFKNSYSFRNLSKLDFSLGYGDASNPNDVEYVAHLEDNDMFPRLETLHIASYITLEIRFINLNSVRKLSLDIHNLKSFIHVNIPNLESLMLSQKFYVILENNLELQTNEGLKRAYELCDQDSLEFTPGIDLDPVMFPKLVYIETAITDVYFLLKFPFIIHFLKESLKSRLLKTVNIPVKIPKHYYNDRNEDLFLKLFTAFKTTIISLLSKQGSKIEAFSNQAKYSEWSADHVLSDLDTVQSLNSLQNLRTLTLSNITLQTGVTLVLPNLHYASLSYTLQSSMITIQSASLIELNMNIHHTTNKILLFTSASLKEDELEQFVKDQGRNIPRLETLSMNFCYRNMTEYNTETQIYEECPLSNHQSLLQLPAEFKRLKALNITGSIFELVNFIALSKVIHLSDLESLFLDFKQITIINEGLLDKLLVELANVEFSINTPNLKTMEMNAKLPKIQKRTSIDKYTQGLINFRLPYSIEYFTFNSKMLNLVSDGVSNGCDGSKSCKISLEVI